MIALEEIDVATRGRAWLTTLAGRRVTVVGLAKSGIAAARLLRDIGADVVGVDTKPLDQLGHEVAALAATGVRFYTGADPAAFERADLVVVSPGVPLDGPQLAPARERGLPLIGELELGWRAMEGETDRHHRHQRQDDHHRAHRRAAVASIRVRCWSPATSARRWPPTR